MICLTFVLDASLDEERWAVGYHHGDLRAALIDAGTQLVAEGGLPSLSVAEAARRTGVSAAAPYRHFPSRQDFVVAVATRAAEDLEETMRTAADAAGDDPIAGIAAAARAYVHFAGTRRAGLDVVYAPELREVPDPELRAAGRSISDVVLLRMIEATGGDTQAAVDLIPQFMAIVHGCATLNQIGLFDNLDESADVAADTACRLVSFAARARDAADPMA